MDLNKIKKVEITSDFITLGQFLKFENIIDSGAFAKEFIMTHKCEVNGETTTQRGKKLHPGDKVTIDDSLLFEITK